MEYVAYKNSCSHHNLILVYLNVFTILFKSEILLFLRYGTHCKVSLLVTNLSLFIYTKLVFINIYEYNL